MSILKAFRKAQTERNFSILFGIGDVVTPTDDRWQLGEDDLSELIIAAIYVDKNNVHYVASPSGDSDSLLAARYEQQDLMMVTSNVEKPNPQFWPGDHVFVQSENTDGFITACFLVNGEDWKYKLGTSLFNVDASDLKLIEEQNKPDIGDEQVLA